nr:helix-turn-helix domain-containing protein [uncultured Carboxylicivirga sp.]
MINNLLVIFLVGSLGLLSFIHLSNPWKINKKGNLYFGIFLFFWASFWIDEIIEITSNAQLPESWNFIVRSVQILITPLLYFTIIFYSNPFYRFRKRDLIHLAIPLIYAFCLYALFNNSTNSSWFTIIVLGIISFQALFYVSISYLKIRKHKRLIHQITSNNQGRDLIWLEYIILQIFITSIIVVIANIFFKTERPGLLINGINVMAVYLIAYFSLRQKEIFPIKKGREKELDYLSQDEDEQETTRRKLISDSELESIKTKLISVMKNEQPFLDSELNLMKLADLVDITPHQLSYTINNGFDLNFFQYVNQHRIEKAKELLNDDSNNYTILAIAFESGFNSKTSFNTTFKKLTHQTPSQFKKSNH